ncbi:cation:proton antiporter [Halobacteriales archaeon QS_1_68_17]|nr:MAG: cation:proton antiporter [Halobacteriales archaeon QS_1_68_17]
MSDARRSPYVESTIIMTTVRVIAPFVMTYGLFVMFHGAKSPGGGFQGGAIVGALVLMLAFAFGADPTREWVNQRVVVGLLVVGVATFVGIGLATMALRGSFLEYAVIAGAKSSKYAIELIELGIGAIVSGVITSLFFLIDAGFDVEADAADAGGETPEETPGEPSSGEVGS